MTRHLVIANQTLGGDQLVQRLEQRIARGRAEFHVLVPMTEPEQETSEWAASDPMFGIERARPTEDAIDVARKRSNRRLNLMIERISSLGGTADGELGDPDPVRAAQQVLDREDFDEVIVSTLPPGLSRWLKMDLPSRISRVANCPVVVVEAE